MVRFHALFWFTGLVEIAFAQSSPLRYMPFGDSITDFGCWRAELWQKLQQAGYKNVDFVGSLNSSTECQGIPDYDRDHEGHSGYLAVDIANKSELVGWLQQNPADIVTMHLGTNDITHNKTTDQIIDAYSTLVDQMRGSNPKMRIIIAQIIPIPAAPQQVIDLNDAIPCWAESLNTTESPIWVVDQFAGFNASDLKDGLHPNDSGDIKMANKWYPALVQAIASFKRYDTKMYATRFVA